MEWTMTLERFGSSIGIDHLVPDVDSSCSLLFDSQYEVTFIHDDEDHSLLMYCEIGSASELGKEACLMLLKASLLGAETGGAAFAIHDKLEKVVLWKRYDDTMTDDDLKEAVNGFLAQVTVWKKKLTELADGIETSEAPADSASTMNNFGMFV